MFIKRINMKWLFSLLVKIIMTPILIAIALLIMIFYSVFGLIVVPSQTIRYLGLLTLGAIRSAFDNKDYTDKFLNAFYEFIKKFVAFYGQLFFIPLAIWRSSEQSPSNLSDLVNYEWEVLSHSWISTILIYSSLIFSFAISFSILGLKGIDYLKLSDLKDKLYNEWLFSEEESTHTDKTLLNTEKEDSIDENRLDSLELIIDKLEKGKLNDDQKIAQLEKELKASRKKVVEADFHPPPVKVVYGRLAIGNGCGTDGKLKVYLDGSYWGEISTYLPSSPGCDEAKTLNKKVRVGSHKVQVRGDTKLWNFDVNIEQDQCTSQFLTCN